MFQIIRGGATPLDLAVVQTCDDMQRYMCLVAGWGMVADVDINSESMRALGEVRFTISEFFIIENTRHLVQKALIKNGS